jgi:hypothetical protein
MTIRLGFFMLDVDGILDDLLIAWVLQRNLQPGGGIIDVHVSLRWVVLVEIVLYTEHWLCASDQVLCLIAGPILVSRSVGLQ